MRLVLAGTRGIPAAYSGFETAVEHLAEGLSGRGHEVTVYCRPHQVGAVLDRYRGARLVHVPTVRSKYTDTLVHTTLSTAHMLSRGPRPDAAVYFIAGNSLVSWVPRPFGVPTLLNVDGLDSERAKWPPAARRLMRACEWLGPRSATLCLTDSHSVAETFLARYGRRLRVVPYGAAPPPPGAGDAAILAAHGLTAGRYLLFVGRLVPENNAHLLIDAYRRIGAEASGLPLVIVGDAPYADAYVAELRAASPPGVRFLGYRFGDEYWALQRGAYVLCAPTEVGGTHPVIVEGLAVGNAVVVHGHAPNRETIGDAGVAFKSAGGAAALAAALAGLIGDPARAADLGRRAAARARARFGWEPVIDAYEELLTGIAYPRGR
jgi:glycosyltransferase involved in cell wall biosynthesis